nr:1-phosphofructokinase [Robinsoniella peoriensis]
MKRLEQQGKTRYLQRKLSLCIDSYTWNWKLKVNVFSSIIIPKQAQRDELNEQDHRRWPGCKYDGMAEIPGGCHQGPCRRRDGMIYTVTFNPALDYIMHIPHMSSGEINRSSSEHLFCGGKGINVSIVLRHLGAESVAMGFQAGFTGNEIVRQLELQGIHTNFVALSRGNSRINVKVKGETETDLNGNGPDITEDEFRQLLDKISVLTGDDTLVLAGSIPACLSSDAYQKIMEQLADRNVKVVVDAERELLVKTLPYHPFLIKPNHHELGGVFGVSCTNEQEIICCIKEIQKMGARNVLVSRAGDGAIFGDEDGSVYRIQAPFGTVKNSVGAGDSMVAGFLKGYESSVPLALKFAASAGSATAFAEDLAERDEIINLLPKVSVSQI